MSQTKAQLIDDLVQPLGHADGTEGAPTLSFKDDEDTGLFRPGDDQVAISTGGTQRLLVENTGLTVNGTTTLNGTTLSLGAEGGANGFINTPESLFFNIDSNNGETGKVFVFAHNDTGQSGTELLRIQDDGKVGIGTNSPGALLNTRWTGTRAGSTGVHFATSHGDSTDYTLLKVSTSEGGTDAATKFLIRGDGRVGVGNAAVVGPLNVRAMTNGNIHFRDITDVVGSGPTGVAIDILNDASTTVNDLALRGATTIFRNASSETVRIDSSGRVLVGTTGAPNSTRLLLQGNNSDANGAAGLRLCMGGDDPVDAENISFITFADNSQTSSAAIQAVREGGTWSSSSHPTQLRFLTTANGSTSATARVTIDSLGRLLVGPTSDYMGNAQAQIQLDRGDGPHICLRRNDAGVSNGDLIGDIKWLSSAGGATEECARIRVEADQTQTSGDKPGRMEFWTTANNASGPTERARITMDGYFKASNAGSSGYTSETSINHEFGQSANSSTIFFRATNASYSSTIGVFRCSRAATSDYFFIACQSSNGNDNEFLLKGDGNANADGSWTGGGADYAEYFEWSDGNTTAEDRRGISVVLDGDKIREAVAGEEPIGVISGNPSMVGDAAWNKWNGKYLRDDFGTYIQNAEGERQLNPDYDPDVEYIPREDRPEWDCVGLMGKLRIRKGQVTGARWIKMRDISDNVEEWLVR